MALEVMKWLTIQNSVVLKVELVVVPDEAAAVMVHAVYLSVLSPTLSEELFC